jgi:hypothetical protein
MSTVPSLRVSHYKVENDMSGIFSSAFGRQIRNYSKNWEIAK